MRGALSCCVLSLACRGHSAGDTVRFEMTRLLLLATGLLQAFLAVRADLVLIQDEFAKCLDGSPAGKALVEAPMQAQPSRRTQLP